MKKFSTTVLVVAVTVLLLGYALWNVDLSALAGVLAGANYFIAFPFLIALTLYFWLKAWRWAIILRPLGSYTISQVTPSMMIGFAANNVLPAHLGEIVRSVWFARRYGQRVSAVLVSQVLERILDVAAILLLFLMSVPWIEGAAPAIRWSVWLVGSTAAAMCAVIYAMLAAPQRVLHVWHVAGARLPVSIRSRGETFLKDILQALSTVQSAARLLLLLANSLLQWSLMGACVWLAMAAVGEYIGPAVTALLLTATVVAVTLPNAPGYVGALQAAFVFALQPFGVSAESAFAGSVFHLVGNWVPITLAGGSFALAARMRA